MSNDANEDFSDGSHYDEGEGLLDDDLNLDNVDELQAQIEAIEAIENPLEKEEVVKLWVKDLNSGTEPI